MSGHDVDRYRVEANPGCGTCGRGGSFDVVGPDGIAIGTSFDDEADAQERAGELSAAFRLGAQQATTIVLGLDVAALQHDQTVVRTIERDLGQASVAEPFAVVERRALRGRPDAMDAWAAAPIVPKVDQRQQKALEAAVGRAFDARCRCRHRDCERCAADRQLVDFACPCECHQRRAVRA